MEICVSFIYVKNDIYEIFLYPSIIYSICFIFILEVLYLVSYT